MLHYRCAIWAEMGLGKTSAVLLALVYLSLMEAIFPVLVMAPLRVANSTWPDEVKKWDVFNHLKVSPVTGSLEERMAGLETKADIYTINYENIPWLIDLYGKKWPFKTIIADESTKLKGFRTRQGGKRTRELNKIAFKYCCRFIQLTGTPSPNGLKDLWGAMWFIDQGKRLGRTYTAFMQRWFTKGWDGYSVVPHESAQAAIEERLADVCLSIRAKDYFDVDDPIELSIYIDLPPKARKLYIGMEKKMFMQLQAGEVEAFNAASKTQKCLQLANGAAYYGEKAKDWEVVHDEKIKALESIIEEAAGMPVLVAYTFRSDLDRLLKAFPSGRHLDKKTKTIDDWNEGKIPILFAHPQSAGHGLNLADGGNILVFFGHTWDLEQHMQIIERLGPVRQAQAGYDRPMFIYHIIARDTIEEAVMERVETKRSVQDLLMEAMRASKNG